MRSTLLDGVVTALLREPRGARARGAPTTARRRSSWSRCCRSSACSSALLWQALLAGETVWLSGSAARAAARAAAVGADPLAAARAVLPPRLERGLRVRREPDGAVALVLRVPAALGDGTLAPVTARARFEAQR